MIERARRAGYLLLTVAGLMSCALVACGEPELSREAKEAEGAQDPTAEGGSPAPGLPPGLGI